MGEDGKRGPTYWQQRNNEERYHKADRKSNIEDA